MFLFIAATATADSVFLLRQNNPITKQKQNDL